MKNVKNKRLFFCIFAAVITLALLLSSCTSQGNEGGDSTAVTGGPDSQAATSTADTDSTDETGSAETTEEETFVYNPEKTEDFYFLRSAGSENIAAAGNALYSERDARLSRDFGFAIKERLSTDIVTEVSAGYNSGEDGELLLLDAVSEGATLLYTGMLENLNTAGINLNAQSECAVGTLVSDLEFAGRVFLLPFRGLCCDLENAYVLELTEEGAFSAALRAAFAEGSYTYTKLLTAIDDYTTDDTYIAIKACDGRIAAGSLLRAAGGKIMIPGSASSNSIPEVNINSASFEKAYSAALNVVMQFSEEDQILNICRLADTDSSAVLILPLPESETGSGFTVPVPADSLTVVAAAKGIVYGRRAAAVLSAVAECSADIRSDILNVGTPYAEKVAEILDSCQHTETAAVFTWGDLFSLTVNDLASLKSYSGFTSEKDLKNRIKVAGQAAEIIRSRFY